MKKIFLVLFILAYSTFAYSQENNFKGLKSFQLVVEHLGNDCQGSKYDKEILTNAKYLLSNSKIEINDTADEYIILNIFTSTDKNDPDTCVSSLEMNVTSFGFVKNSAGYEWFSKKLVYEKAAIAWTNGPTSAERHRDYITRNFDQWIKELIIDWSEAQKD